MKKSRPLFQQSSPSQGHSTNVVTHTLFRLAGKATACLSKAASSHLLISKLVVFIASVGILLLEVLR